MGIVNVKNFSPLILRHTVSSRANTDAADILVTTRSLRRLGHLRQPTGPVTEKPNREFFVAIKSFQHDRGLKVDGVMRPGGETAREFGLIFSRSSFNPAVTTPANDDKAASDAQCDHLYWNVDIPTCRAIEARRGKRAAARCYHTATFRYAACLRGTPINQLPPLDTWNQ
jgi:hypothetical protein